MAVFIGGAADVADLNDRELAEPRVERAVVAKIERERDKSLQGARAMGGARAEC